MPSRPEQQWPFRWDLLLRYRFIETIALWEGRLTTRHLCDTFGIGRQQASKDINNYMREVGPGNLEYDKFLKGYKPTAGFEPRVTQGLADEYLHLMARNNELMNVFESLSLNVANVEVLSLPVRDVKPEVLRPIMQAARQQKRLDVDYVSLNHPDREGRIIVPHTLVYSGLRWHVRAWCEKNREYRDFVLSRFRGIPEIMDDSEHGVEGDTEWNTQVIVRIAPDPRLTPGAAGGGGNGLRHGERCAGGVHPRQAGALCAAIAAYRTQANWRRIRRHSRSSWKTAANWPPWLFG